MQTVRGNTGKIGTGTANTSDLGSFLIYTERTLKCGFCQISDIFMNSECMLIDCWIIPKTTCIFKCEALFLIVWITVHVFLSKLMRCISI